MSTEPSIKRAIAFFDGQNLFRSVKEAFDYSYPNYDPIALATKVCNNQGWQLSKIHFYTGIPTPSQNEFWYKFWKAKLGALGHKGIHVFSRSLRSRIKIIKLPDESELKVPTEVEKGIDVRIAIDMVRMAYRNQYDVALLFSQNQDFSEVADDIRLLARENNRWIKIASVFPKSPATKDARGVQNADWIAVDRDTYDQCLDHRDYRPKTKSRLQEI